MSAKTILLIVTLFLFFIIILMVMIEKRMEKICNNSDKKTSECATPDAKTEITGDIKDLPPSFWVELIKIPKIKENKMDKKMFDYFISEIQNGKGRGVFDTWGKPEGAFLYSFFKTKKLIELDGSFYFVYYINGVGPEMGTSPTSVIVSLIDTDKAEQIPIENADEKYCDYLAKMMKEVDDIQAANRGFTKISDEQIKGMAKSGELCKILGHVFTVSDYMFESERHCQLCGQKQVKKYPDWVDVK